MNIRAPDTKRGRYDDLIAQLRLFKTKLEIWAMDRQAHGMFFCVLTVMELQPNRSAMSFVERKRGSELELHWQAVSQAWLDIVNEMEGWLMVEPDALKHHIDNIASAIKWFEQNNTQEDSGIKY